MTFELVEDKIYPITDGNGGVVYAHIITGSLSHYRVTYERRKRRGGKAQFTGVYNVSRKAFRNLIKASGEPV